MKDTKFRIGDISTTTMELEWNMREADLANATYWPPRPPRPKGHELTASMEWAILSLLHSYLGAPDHGEFTCRPKVATLARIIDVDCSTVRRYLICLR